MTKIKKTISLILTAIMLLTAVPVQSFALFDNLNPTVEKVEFADDLPVSNKDVQSSYYMGDAIGKTMIVGIGNSHLYDYKVYLSNGKVLEAKDGYYSESKPLLNRVQECVVTLMVDPKECADAIAQGKTTVTTEVVVMLYTRNESLEPFTFELEKEIVPEVVSNIRLLDSMPEIKQEYILTPDFAGKKFEVEFATGEKKETEYGEDYFFGDETIYIWYETKSYADEATGESGCVKLFNLDYLDNDSAFYEEKLPCPYEKIEILDYTVGDGGVTGVTYRITYKDGRTVENTKNFDPVKEADGTVVIDTIDGNDISVYISFFNENYYFGIWAGYYDWNISDAVEGESRELCDCICHENGIKYIISLILCKIWEIFGIKEVCQCGSWHW